MKIINPVEISATASSGAWSGNAPYIQGVLTTVRCKFDTASTTFILTINDKDGIPIYKSEIMTGSLVEQVALGVRGTYSIVISDASADEDFKVRLEIEE